jgi:hypothetical protein
MNISYLNDALAGRKILSVEEGTTPGWMVIKLEPPAEWPRNVRMYLTVFVGGRKQKSSEDGHYWTVALHSGKEDDGGIADPIRDGRDAEMPMSSAAD